MQKTQENKKIKILVIGESAVDIYHYGSVDRICPEGPVPVLVPKSRFVYNGMAENVVNNIKSLRPEYKVDFFTQDYYIKKERFCEEGSGHLLLRVDEGDEIPREKSFDLRKFEAFLRLKNGEDFLIEEISRYYDAIVFSDYDKGFVNETQIQFIISKIDTKKCPIFVDTKKVLGSWVSGANFLKINKKEYENVLKNNPDFKHENLIVTLGKDGAKRICGLEERKIECFNSIPNDVSGAGDSYLAGLLVSYLENGKNIFRAMKYASVVAGISVSKRGTATVTEEEVLEKNAIVY